MVNGVHAIIYSKDAEAVRAFFSKTLKLRHVDAGRGWLIFALPPAELGVHPAENNSYELYLMCNDIERSMKELRSSGAKFPRGVTDAGWGKVTAIELPGGLEMGLYEPRHPTAIGPAKKATHRPPKKRKAAAKKRPRKR